MQLPNSHLPFLGLSLSFSFSFCLSLFLLWSIQFCLFIFVLFLSLSVSSTYLCLFLSLSVCLPPFLSLSPGHSARTDTSPRHLRGAQARWPDWRANLAIPEGDEAVGRRSALAGPGLRSGEEKGR